MKPILALAALFAVLAVSASAQTTQPLPFLYSRTIGGYGSGTALNLPAGVFVDNSGNIYAGDGPGNRAVKFNSAGVFQPLSFPTTGFAWGVIADKNGYVYVTDDTANRIIVYTSQAVFVKNITSVSPLSSTPLNGPGGMALDNNGNLYVADQNNNRVVKFNPSGVASAIFGSAATLSGPRSVALDSSGYVYVADFGNNRAVEFDSSGGFVRNFGNAGSGNGLVITPRGVAVDSAGNVYVGDNNGRVVEFDSKGVFKQNIGTAGNGDGQINQPRGINFDSNGSLYVADAVNNRILEFTQSVFSGTITLEGLGTYPDTTGPDQNITFTFHPQGSGTQFVMKQVLTPAGTFAFANIPAGTYDVAIKGACWLTKVVHNVRIPNITPNNSMPLNVTLLGSDLNNDNSVDPTDFGILVGDYGAVGDAL